MIECASSSGDTTTARGSRMRCLLDGRFVVGEHVSYSCLETVNVGGWGRESRLRVGTWFAVSTSTLDRVAQRRSVRVGAG